MAVFQSHFGWTFLAPTEIKRATAALEGGDMFVLDEIGFLELHQRYADVFFPGTSVLQTRVRYVFFVAWIYRQLWESRVSDCRSELAELEKRVVRQLLNFESQHSHELSGKQIPGIIGRQFQGKRPVVMPPSQTYWTALRAWAMLKPGFDGRLLSRNQLHRLIESRVPKQNSKEEAGALDEMVFPLDGVPGPERNWLTNPLSFDLTRDEREYLLPRLQNLAFPGRNDELCLLAQLAGKEYAWDNIEVLEWPQRLCPLVCEKSKDAVRSAAYGAALAGIGRGVYAALVEWLKEKDGIAGVGSRHRDHLKCLVKKYRPLAMLFDLNQSRLDIEPLTPSLQHILVSTLDWLKSDKDNFEELYDIYRCQEMRRKAGRARLAQSPRGRQKRDEWEADKYALAVPIHYRWRTVRQQLDDLAPANRGANL